MIEPSLQPALPRRTLRVARAVASRLFDGGEGVPAARLDRSVRYLADWTRYAGPKARVSLRLAAVAVQFSPFLLVRRFRRFTALEPDDQRRHLEAMESHPFFSLPFAGIKSVLAITWFEDSEESDLPEQVRRPRESDPRTIGIDGEEIGA